MKNRRRVRNRLLGITRNIIPYVRELRAVAGSTSATVVMQQLDYWFIRYPDGFYKFLDATPTAKLYHPGQSWCEELGFTKDEFRTAFDRIGYRWSSKSQFEAAKDKFQGKLYASYVDRRNNLTWYFRNHEQVDQILDNLLETDSPDSQGIGNANLREIDNPDLQGMGKVHLQEIGKPDSGGLAIPISGDRQTRFTVNRESQHPIYTETTTTENTEITSEQLQAIPQPEAACSRHHFYFSKNFSDRERKGILRLLSDLDAETAQNIIDEVTGIRLKGQIRQSPVSLAAELAKRAREGHFIPALALEVEKRRDRECRLLKEHQDSVRNTLASTKAGKKAISEIKILLKTPTGSDQAKGES